MKRDKIRNEYLYDTSVENIFINEYMPKAPGDFLKVYLFCLMQADLNQKFDQDYVARALDIVPEAVEEALIYWAKLGAIKRNNDGITIVSFKEKLYGDKDDDGEGFDGKKDGKKKEDIGVSQGDLHLLQNKEMKKMIHSIEKSVGRQLAPTEITEIYSWLTDFDAAPEVIVYGFAYCAQRRKDNINYISKVILGWTSRGFRTVLDVEKFLKENDQRHYVYKRIMRALGFSRNATEEEKRIIDSWFDDMNFKIEVVLEACKKTTGISNPNINYINKVLKNWSTQPGGGNLKASKVVAGPGSTSGKNLSYGDPLAEARLGVVTKSMIDDYYKTTRERNEAEAKKRRQEVYNRLPQVEALEEEVRATHVDISRTMVSGGADKLQQLNKLKQQINDYRKMIERHLIEGGFGVDYMEVHYECPICKDTGKLDDGSTCKCQQKVIEKLKGPAEE